MATIYDVARLAGVSPGTVSNALNHAGKVAPETEKRILEAIEQVKYVPNRMARSLKTNRSRSIFVIAEDVRAFPAPRILDGISEYCHEAGYDLTLFNLRISPEIRNFDYGLYLGTQRFRQDLAAALAQAKSLHTCAVIYAGIYPRDMGNVFPPLDIPVAFCYTYSHGLPSVNCNDYTGARLAAEQLLKTGHRKIGVILGKTDALPTHRRLSGFADALGERGVTLPPEYVAGGGGWSYEDGREACRRLLCLPDRPTAIFSMSDVMAAGAVHAAQDAGLCVPDDLSVHGYDNYEGLSFFRPALTTIEMPLGEIGRRGAQLAISLSEGRAPEKTDVLVECRLLERASVAPPGKG